jgi:hypothetical protein
LEANLVAHGLGKAFQHSAMVIQHAEKFSHLCLDAREPLGSFAFKLKVATLKLQVLTLKLDVSSVSFRHPSQKRRLPPYASSQPNRMYVASIPKKWPPRSAANFVRNGSKGGQGRLPFMLFEPKSPDGVNPAAAGPGIEGTSFRAKFL